MLRRIPNIRVPSRNHRTCPGKGFQMSVFLIINASVQDKGTPSQQEGTYSCSPAENLLKPKNLFSREKWWKPLIMPFFSILNQNHRIKDKSRKARSILRVNFDPSLYTAIYIQVQDRMSMVLTEQCVSLPLWSSANGQLPRSPHLWLITLFLNSLWHLIRKCEG